MWIGRIPWELVQLTFAEQLLIVLLYPWVYVFKLYPKWGTRESEVNNLQHAMCGNMSTFEINNNAIIDMLEGRLMPQPPEILALLIIITFIAVGQISNQWLQNLFQVH